MGKNILNVAHADSSHSCLNFNFWSKLLLLAVLCLLSPTVLVLCLLLRVFCMYLCVIYSLFIYSCFMFPNYISVVLLTFVLPSVSSVCICVFFPWISCICIHNVWWPIYMYFTFCFYFIMSMFDDSACFVLCVLCYIIG